MYDFSKIPLNNITKEWILSKISDNIIFSYYFGKFELNKCYQSKLRKDNNPSVGFYLGKKGQIMYNDFSTGEKHDCFSFVQRLYNLDFPSTLRQIATDFGLINNVQSKVPIKVFLDASAVDKEQKKETKIQFIPYKGFTKEALRYWRLYEITEEELKRERVFQVKQLFINKREVKNVNNDLQFAFVEPHAGIKIYTPYSKTIKHLTNIPLDKPFGLGDLQYKSDTVFITKSSKDKIVLKKLFTDVIATQNESEAALPIDVQEMLLKRFKKAIIVWDADSTGVENCRKFNEKGFGYFNTPREEYEKYGIKDCSDYVEFYSIEMLKDLFRAKKLLT